MKKLKPRNYPWISISKNVPIWGRGTIVAFLICHSFTNSAGTLESVFHLEKNFFCNKRNYLQEQ